MGMSQTAHPSRPVASTATITLVLLILGSVGQSGGQILVRKPTRPLRLSQQQQQAAAYERPRSSKVGNTSDLQRFFEVSKPVISSSDHHVEMIQLLYHAFAFTYNVPPANASYVPTKTVLGKKWDKVVLKWSAVCQGVQFDRISAVWLGGVEIFRTTTAEPTPQGIIWDVATDVTRYASLWEKPQQVVVSLNNVVDSTYTGIFNVTLSVHFYKVGNGSGNAEDDHGEDFQSSEEAQSNDSEHSKLEDYSENPADMVIPAFSEANYFNSSGGYGGYWFYLSNQNDYLKVNKSLQIPPNTYKAVLEVCVSAHGDDEFWYVNPNANGAFREVVVLIDFNVVGVVYPYPAIYTGGYNPAYWQPAAGIGAFDLPTYNLDITPLVGNLLDGQNHSFHLTVTDALDYWLLQANLHIWVDPKRESTSGSLVELKVPLSSNPNNSTGPDGTVTTTASRNFSYAGYVVSSFGNLTTSSSYALNFSNIQSSAVDQSTTAETVVVVKTAEKEVSSHRVQSSYPFSIDDQQDITHALNQDIQYVKTNSSFFSSLVNNQAALSNGTTEQNFYYTSSEGCYQRAINVEYNVLVNDTSTTNCSSTS